MTDQLLDRIILFASQQLGVPVEKLSPSTRLSHDLGIDGTRGAAFMQTFAERFDVDLTTFEPAHHFGDKASINPAIRLRWTLTGSWPPLRPITMAHLADAARSHSWAIVGRTTRATSQATLERRGPASPG
jgi:hypothetical protein